MRIVPLFLLLFVLLTLNACDKGEPTPEQRKATLLLGQKVYDDSCSSCHKSESTRIMLTKSFLVFKPKTINHILIHYWRHERVKVFFFVNTIQ